MDMDAIALSGTLLFSHMIVMLIPNTGTDTYFNSHSNSKQLDSTLNSLSAMHHILFYN